MLDMNPKIGEVEALIVIEHTVTLCDAAFSAILPE